jgi:hypothetical protein
VAKPGGNSARVAIYAAPQADDPLWAFGSRTIGYDAVTGLLLEDEPPLGLAPEAWRALTAEPRSYGFHGTLKAPFRLADEVRSTDLATAITLFCAQPRALICLPLKVAAIGAFLAVVPVEPSPALDRLAAEVVFAFESFRAPLEPDERARRLGMPLSERQLSHLDHFGYPYVLEDFCYHMTLTGKIADAGLRQELCQALGERLRARTAGTFALQELVVFVQRAPTVPFRIASRHLLATS